MLYFLSIKVLVAFFYLFLVVLKVFVQILIVHDYCVDRVVSILGFKGSFWVAVATEEGLYLIDDIDSVVGLNVVDKVDALVKPSGIVVEKDEPLMVLTLGKPLIDDHFQCGL